MEPADLNLSDDARIEACLRRRVESLPDEDFSNRVLAALPPTRSLSRVSRQIAIGVGTAAGVIVAGLGVMRRPVAPVDLPGIAAELSRAATLMFDPGFCVAVIVTLISLTYVFRRRLRLV
jgi:hypothetical protein